MAADGAAYGYWCLRDYCRSGERSAHTWFVLHELLGRREVKNYDGGWTE